MNENFRLLEYKRKKYIEKKRERSQSQSKSPPKGKDVMTDPQRNFLTSLYGGPASNGKHEQKSINGRAFNSARFSIDGKDNADESAS